MVSTDRTVEDYGQSRNYLADGPITPVCSIRMVGAQVLRGWQNFKGPTVVENYSVAATAPSETYTSFKYTWLSHFR